MQINEGLDYIKELEIKGNALGKMVSKYRIYITNCGVKLKFTSFCLEVDKIY